MISISTEISGNFIAVDLIDYEQRVAYQVTSVSRRDKIDKTIEKFNKSDLIYQIDNLNFLILDTENHGYNGPDTILLENGRSFSYSKNIMNFNKLMEEIEQKEVIKSGIIVKIYDAISMVYDSGRLKYFSIVKATEVLAESLKYESDETVLWKKGYGDIQLTAFIPLSYESKLSCRLEIRQHNLAGAYITFEQETLLQDYFLEEEEFELKHNIGRDEDEEEMWMQLEHIRLKINAHTAAHVYELFAELKEEYEEGMQRIDSILGTAGLQRIGKKYYLLTIKETEWEKILLFAREHDWFEENAETEWNIFNNNRSRNRLILSSNVHGKIQGDILAEISVESSEKDFGLLDVFWEPGFKVGKESMECFDNIIKWKADYTQNWIINRLLPKAQEFYDQQYNKKFVWQRIRKWYNDRIMKNKVDVDKRTC